MEMANGKKRIVDARKEIVDDSFLVIGYLLEINDGYPGINDGQKKINDASREIVDDPKRIVYVSKRIVDGSKKINDPCQGTMTGLNSAAGGEIFLPGAFFL